MTSRSLAVLLLLFASAASSAPFPLIDPEPVPAWTLSEPVIGASSEGFLLVGAARTMQEPYPALLALDPSAQPRHLMPAPAAIGALTSLIVPPVFAGDRWFIANTKVMEERVDLLIAQVRADGNSAGPTVRFPVEEVPWALSWNGRRLLVVLRPRNADGIVVRTAPGDLSSITPARTIDLRGQVPRVIPRSDGFHLLYRDPHGPHLLRSVLLDDDGVPRTEPRVVMTAPLVTGFDLAAGVAGDPLAAWIEGFGTIRAARIGTEPVSPVTVAIVPDTERPPVLRWASVPGVHVHAAGDGFLIVWQELVYDRFPTSSTLHVQRVDANGNKTGQPVLYSMPLDATLRDIGESTGLFAFFQRNSTGQLTQWALPLVANPTAHPLTLGTPRAQGLKFTPADSERTIGVWEEETAAGDRLMLGMWDRTGKRLAVKMVRFLERRNVGFGAAVGGDRILVAWSDGEQILAAYAERDTLTLRQPMVLATRSGEEWAIVPRVAWDGSRFVVVWSNGGRLEGAAVDADKIDSFGTMLDVVPARPRSTPPGRYPMAVAATPHGFVAVQHLLGASYCNHARCTSTFDYEELTRFDREGRLLDRRVRIAPPYSQSTIATDGSDYVLIADTADGITSRSVSGTTSAVGPERLLFRHPASSSRAIGWDGTNYVLAWGYGLAGPWPNGAGGRGAAMLLDRSGVPVASPRHVRAGAGSAVAAFAGDALVAAVLPVVGQIDASMLWGELLSDTGTLLVSPPPTPIVTVTRLDLTGAELSWQRVPGAIGYYIQTLDEEGRWGVSLFGDADMTSLGGTFFNPVFGIRIIAVTDTGASEPFEIRVPGSARRRAVSR